MAQEAIHSRNHSSTFASLWLLAAAICLCPAAAGATCGLAANDTATGAGALASECGGSDNTADGYSTLFSNTTGVNNTASGVNALNYNTIGNANTASGWQALFYNTTGSNNTASGYQALFANTGNNNTASGYFALHSNTAGSYNTALGYQALVHINGNSNVAVGPNALYALTAGHQNIALGLGAGGSTTSGNSNIYIGNGGVNGSESNVTRIGSVQTKTFIAGISGTAVSGAPVVINGNGQLGVATSSARYKEDIEPLAGASNAMGGKLAQLRPVSFRYKSEPEATHYGLIAEEVDKVMPELVVRDKEKRPDAVQYMELVPLLLQQWKAQQAENARQRELNARQEAENAQLRAELAELRHTLATRFAALDKAAQANSAR